MAKITRVGIPLLPELPEGLINSQQLQCENNQITTLPDNYIDLQRLRSENNQLTKLPDTK